MCAASMSPPRSVDVEPEPTTGTQRRAKSDGKSARPCSAEQRANLPRKCRRAQRIETGIDGGTRLTVQVPAGAHTVQLRADAGPARWSLAVTDGAAAAGDAGAGQEEIARLIAQGRAGKYADALVGLTRFRE